MSILRRAPDDRPAPRSTKSTANPDGPILPPGELDSLDELEKADRTAILRRGVDLGPIFKGMAFGDLCICIVGLQRSRRFLLEHSERLLPRTLDLKPLVPNGFLRQMSGETHTHYRRAIVRASRALDPIVDQAVLDTIIASGLSQLVAASGDDVNGPSPLLEIASSTATAELIALFFGVAPGSDVFSRLVRGYQRLGPYGLVWNLAEPQFEAFAEIKAELRAELSRFGQGQATMSDACVLGQLVGDGEVDDTMLGNLIYMVEMGRYDMAIFFRWLIRYAAANPNAMARVATEVATEPTPPSKMSAAESFVLEVLRSDQAERLMREALCDLTFDNYLIPKGAFVRVCVWESHHSPDSFTDPYRFDPERFLQTTPTNDQFSPFGIDNHQCPFGGLSIRLGITLVRALATAFRTTTVTDGRPIRGAYHWEPSRKLRVNVTHR